MRRSWITSFRIRIREGGRWHILAEALIEHAAKYDVVFVQTTEYGLCYSVIGKLTTPSGRKPVVLSAWFFDTGSEIPRLISAFPG